MVSKSSSSQSGQECVFNYYYLLAIALRCERDDAFFLKAFFHCITTFILALHYGTLFCFRHVFLLPQL